MENLVDSSAMATVQIRRIFVLKGKHSAVLIFSFQSRLKLLQMVRMQGNVKKKVYGSCTEMETTYVLEYGFSAKAAD
jgi:hypothetical protein